MGVSSLLLNQNELIYNIIIQLVLFTHLECSEDLQKILCAYEKETTFYLKEKETMGGHSN